MKCCPRDMRDDAGKKWLPEAGELLLQHWAESWNRVWEAMLMRVPWSPYKPAAPARMHLLLAAVMWSSVGSALLFFGVRWIRAAGVSHVASTIGVAVLLGVLKSRLVLHRTAKNTISRIRKRGDGRCLGGFLSWRSWSLVLLMAVCGRLLRGSGLPAIIVGFVYVAVGVALLVTSLTLWHDWYQQISADAERE